MKMIFKLKKHEKDEGDREENKEKRKYLSREEIEEKIKELRGKMPSYLIYKIRRSIQDMDLTEEQLEEIISRAWHVYLDIEKNKPRDIKSAIAERVEGLEKEIKEAGRSIESLRVDINSIGELQELSFKKIREEIKELRGVVEDILADLQLLTMRGTDIDAAIQQILEGGDENE